MRLKTTLVQLKKKKRTRSPYISISALRKVRALDFQSQEISWRIDFSQAKNKGVQEQIPTFIITSLRKIDFDHLVDRLADLLEMMRYQFSLLQRIPKMEITWLSILQTIQISSLCILTLDYLKNITNSRIRSLLKLILSNNQYLPKNRDTSSLISQN